VKERGGELLVESVTKASKCSLTMTSEDGTKSETVEGFELETESGKKLQARSIILATGTERRKLGVPGEIEYTGKGVMYCAICEKQDYEGKVVAVVGGGNSAVQAAVEVAEFASKVYVLYRGSELRGDPIWLEQIKNNPKIEVIYNSVVKTIKGDDEALTGVNFSITTGGSVELKDLAISKLFIEIGGVPGTALVIPLGVQMDEGGYIKVDEHLCTNVKGIYAAGDLVNYGLSIEQISSAVGLGARAASSVFAYLKNDKAPSLWGKAQIKRPGR
jgi:thioredoxin reductase (NADPH)